jgi:hypothetical protein
MDNFCYECRKKFFPLIKAGTPGYEVGKTDKGKRIFFADLYAEYQLALQNSHLWEKWQEQSMKLGGENSELRFKLKEAVDKINFLEKFLNRQSINLDDAQDALASIRDEVDSLAWAKKISKDELEKLLKKPEKDPSEDSSEEDEQWD